ncbi:hypothetical protein CRP01_28370 [Flavilitoribacter nigricans DSM 23189 = NBRC 102662]|uniref:Uncharacterized protein n=1 Tax=Flavilitoribacter nigricans (strain ATCC 23147 / DSM 23189 / NBRC 102662 / NCIMB 1420 / SS-2) TaxID=1122177 RepID=A0A2D0N4J1_FLAN2|nr:hypothetical protein CRP01_28370 [Flavilitoribacter nigricans DSM 23189 = NBRC 102662]
MNTFGVLARRITATVAAKHFYDLEYRRIIAPVLAHLPAKVARHLAVLALLDMIVIDGVAVIAD